MLLANRLRMRPLFGWRHRARPPGVTAPLHRPMDPGPRLLARPAGIVGLIVLTLVLAFVIFLSTR